MRRFGLSMLPAARRRRSNSVLISLPAVGHWSNYPMTVARRLARNFAGPLRGADIALRSDLPPAAGMSSSSAMMIAVFKVLAQVNRLADQARVSRTSPRSARLGCLPGDHRKRPELRPAGRRPGRWHVRGQRRPHGHLLLPTRGICTFSPFARPDWNRCIAFPADYVLAIASSGVLAEKTGEAMAKYNRASRLVSALLELWNTHTGRDDRCLADAARSRFDAPAAFAADCRRDSASPV